MRLFLIPGFGEDRYIFEKIQDHLPGEKVFLNHWHLVGEQARPELNVLSYARELINWFNITKDDVVIGHSMGGWVALYIKHLVHCPIVQIASWTEPKKVATPVTNCRLVFWLTKRGFYLNRLVKSVVLWRDYRGKSSASLFNSIFEQLIRGNKDCVINQLRVIFNPVGETVTEAPDLRIHARADRIIRFPDQPVCEVPGDHFCLYTDPEPVWQPIVNFLQQHSKSSG